MNFNWLAIALHEVTWIALAFALGFMARALGLPPLIGFLAAGFLLGAQGVEATDTLLKFADLGITLLLFTIGLKLNVRTLARPQVWAVASIHMVITVLAFAIGIYALAFTGLSSFAGLGLEGALLVAFALSFSSTVFVVKILEQRGEVASLHGRVAIGILIVQDIAAVLFIALSTAKVPSAWALLVIVLLLPLQPVLRRLLGWVGHSELLVLFGFVVAMGGAELFELVGLKGDVGALVLGVMLASHGKADELNKTMMGFKNLFLLGFFLSVGLSGSPTVSTVVVAAAFIPLIFLKSALFFMLLTRFKLRARTALFASIDLGNYSEFGLIVAALAATQGWISFDWLVVIAVALSFSFVLASLVNRYSYTLYDRYREFWLTRQSPERLAYDGIIDIGGARVLVIGMGGVGSGAFELMNKHYPGLVFGVDTDLDIVRVNSEENRNVLRGDPADRDFWERVNAAECVELVMLALPRIETSLAVIRQLKDTRFTGQISAIARYADEVRELERAGADVVFNIYSGAGRGFASQVLDRVKPQLGSNSGM
ncbi:MAG: cation:proton antiporter [Xanthomonadales bacterium]|nr:cation:proton antiporter [Xanthomonadales bacterium]